jgi:hypothetical protein
MWEFSKSNVQMLFVSNGDSSTNEVTRSEVVVVDIEQSILCKSWIMTNAETLFHHTEFNNQRFHPCQMCRQNRSSLSIVIFLDELNRLSEDSLHFFSTRCDHRQRTHTVNEAPDNTWRCEVWCEKETSQSFRYLILGSVKEREGSMAMIEELVKGGTGEKALFEMLENDDRIIVV